MTRDEFYLMHEEILSIPKGQKYKEIAKKIALKKTLSMNLEDRVDLPPISLALGRKTNLIVESLASSLHVTFGNDLPIVVSIAMKSYWYSLWKLSTINAAVMKMEGDLEDSNLSNFELFASATPDGVAKETGWADVLITACSSNELNQELEFFIIQYPGIGVINRSIIFKCMSLIWFRQSSNELNAGSIDLGLDSLYEANRTLSFIEEEFMYETGVEQAEEQSLEKVRSKLGTEGSNALHADTYALRADVVAYWRENIAFKLSAEKAAKILIKHFALSHRKLAEYVSFEKKLRGAAKV